MRCQASAQIGQILADIGFGEISGVSTPLLHDGITQRSLQRGRKLDCRCRTHTGYTHWLTGPRPTPAHQRDKPSTYHARAKPDSESSLRGSPESEKATIRTRVKPDRKSVV